jgi:hypothetical protein
MTTNEPIEQFEHYNEHKEYEISLDKARELLSEVPFTEMEDASWTWARPTDDGQYVALSEGDWVEIYLTESEGEIVLSGHRDATGSVSFEGDEAMALRSEALRSKGPRMASEHDLDAVRRIVEDETAGYARSIEYACGWTDGNPERIRVTPEWVTVRYPGALPQAVAGPLRQNIVDGLRNKGFDYRGRMYGGGTVQIVPREG